MVVSEKCIRSMLDRTGVRERFWDGILRSSGCWLWTRHKTKGYGMFKLDGRNAIGAHRAAWYYSTGLMPGKLLVCHKCDVPACVNPEHLFLGTFRDNALDMARKGRRYEVDNSGSKNGMSILNEQSVRRIRERLSMAKAGHRKAARRSLAVYYGVSLSAITSVDLRYTWKEESSARG